jgi:hypothetical protein
MNSPGEIVVLKQAWSVGSIWSIWFVWLIETNQMTQINQINETNQKNKIRGDTNSRTGHTRRGDSGWTGCGRDLQ